MDSVVTVEGLRKAYGGVHAADDVTFDVHRGEVFGMVGPFGA
jgi:ABC-type branched-subunit amino acid transport system ATPase component